MMRHCADGRTFGSALLCCVHFGAPGQKPVVLVKCGGPGSQWRTTVVGLLAGEREVVDMSAVDDATALTALADQVVAHFQAPPAPGKKNKHSQIAAADADADDEHVSSAPSPPPPPPPQQQQQQQLMPSSGRTPEVGDAVISYHTKTRAYYESTIASELDRDRIRSSGLILTRTSQLAVPRC